jgi:hypothetical protein
MNALYFRVYQKSHTCTLSDIIVSSRSLKLLLAISIPSLKLLIYQLRKRFPLLLHGGSDSLHMRLWARSDIRHETESFKCPRENFASCQSGDRVQRVEEKYPAATETNATPAEGTKKAGFL